MTDNSLNTKPPNDYCARGGDCRHCIAPGTCTCTCHAPEPSTTVPSEPLRKFCMYCGKSDCAEKDNCIHVPGPAVGPRYWSCCGAKFFSGGKDLCGAHKADSPDTVSVEQPRQNFALLPDESQLKRLQRLDMAW